MKAAVYYEAGPPSVFRYEDVPDPPCHPNGVLIDVKAISIEGGDVLNEHVEIDQVVRNNGTDSRDSHMIADIAIRQSSVIDPARQFDAIHDMRTARVTDSHRAEELRSHDARQITSCCD